MTEILAQLEMRREAARAGGGEARVASQHSKGKLTARERIELLLDEGSFEEYDMFVTNRSHELDSLPHPDGSAWHNKCHHA